MVLGRTVYRFLTITVRTILRTKNRFGEIIIDKIEEPIALMVIQLGIWWGGEGLYLEKSVRFYFEGGMEFALTMGVAWLIIRMTNALIEGYVTPKTKGELSKIDDSMLPVIERILGIFIWVITFIVGLRNIGYNVSSLLAGLGIGGFAVAFAARATLGNILGGLTIFILQPFRTGDRIIIQNYDGFVEKIGLSMTRIRTFMDRSLVFIPNQEFIEKSITNITQGGAFRSELNFRFLIDTELRKIQKFIEGLEMIVANHPNLVNEEHKISITKLDEYGIHVGFIFYVKVDTPLFETRTNVAMQVLKLARTEDVRMVVRSTLKTFPAPESEMDIVESVKEEEKPDKKDLDDD